MSMQAVVGVPVREQDVPVVAARSLTSRSPCTDSALPLARPSISSAEALAALTGRLGYPAGLARQMIASSESMPYRFWIVDNSGSMQTPDGKRLVEDARGKKVAVGATRWEELTQVVLQTAEVAAAVGARVDFHLLNSIGPQPQFMTLVTEAAAAADTLPVSSLCTVDQMRQTLRSITPGGRTPLTNSVELINASIQSVAPRLAAAGQKAVVVIATDGLPDDPRTFLAALQALQTLPVWVVVRLCTSDDSVVEYWNDLDARLEAPLEVLDDEVGEAKEVHAAGNTWLTYAPQLQLARQFGMRSKLFDLIDENRLLPSQVAIFCDELFDCGPLPEPELGLPAFRAAVDARQAKVPLVFDPIRHRMQPWIDTRKIGAGKSASCAVM